MAGRPDLAPAADQDADRRRFHKSIPLFGIAQVLRRHRWSHQVPACRATERDERAVAVTALAECDVMRAGP
ncbi:winged helix-turn-helix domain-containing protein [Streptomyces sp. NPDC020883]|uniref:winged helix-turn-helix domain-containing protein n=1 Tax=Streptomyces sp. NPDC020883 TaxID=3365099 RepID=UPI003794201D